MRCRYCAEAAGWMRRACSDCTFLLEQFQANRGADMPIMMDLFLSTGASLHKVERFLDSDLDDAATVRDHIIADATNQLLEAFGQSARKTPSEVRRIRERGAWVHMDRPPEE